MNTNSNCKKGINWKKLLFTMLCGVVAFSTMFLTACGKKKEPSDPTPPEVGGDWYTGAELPTANTGSLGDFYFKTDSYQVYKLCNDGWKLIVELNSLLGQEGVSWHYGNDEPSEFVGVPGDYYLDQTDGDIYFSGSNGWEKVYNLMGVSTDQVADGEVAEVYIGYDGYVWIGDSRTTHRPKTIVGANDIVDNTLELKKGYFTSMQLDTTSHAVALMSGYKVVNEGEANEYATTSYSHTTLTNIQFYADADGLLELAVANVKDVLAKVTAGQEIESTTKAVVEVKEGFNNLTVSVVVGYNETLVLGGTNTTSKLYVVTGVTADDDYGVISSVNEGNKNFNSTDGIKDKLVLKAKAGAHTILTESYIKTETTHGHPCANCSAIFDIENHTYQNGVCTVCNYSHINHSSTVYDNISSSTHSKICDVCGITYGEGNHTYGEHTSIDYAKHYQECTECGYRLEGTHNYLNATCTDCGYIHVNHLSTNYDNVNNDEHSKVCDVCGQIYALDFHTFNSYTSFDKTKHYRQCSICQYIRYEDHNFLNSTCVDCNYTCTEHNYTNGECTCGATHPCPGNGEFVFVTENTVDDKCIKECSECGLQVELTHNYIDGVCSNCTHSHQAHEYTLGVCDICDFEHQNHSCDTYTKIDNEKHGKTCEVCHVVYDVVDHTLSEYKVYNIHQHYRNCTACDYVVSESHNYIDGTCTICNHTCTSHEYTNGECVCGYDHECDLVNSYTYSSASGDANCLRTCTVCNRQTELAHDYENGECANCGHNHTEHNWSNGACTECEVEHDNHTFGEFAYQDSATHGRVCSTCGLVSEIGNHNYVDSTCTICNHTCTSHEWEDGACTNCHITHDCEAGNSFSHANATDDLCIKNCTTCGKAYTNAEHGYYLGTCVYCGHSHVNHIEDGWTVDEDSHYKYCAVCTALLESGEHNLGEIDKNSSDIQNHYRYCSICERGVGEEHTYQDGVCTECDYECEHMWSNGTCSNCHITHDCGADWDVSAVYVGEEGWHDIVCNICHARYGSDPHNYNGDATCDDCNYIHTNHTYENGICTVCGHECEHNFGELKDLNGGEHYRECSICKYQEIENHELNNMCYCTTCGYHDCDTMGWFGGETIDDNTCYTICMECKTRLGIKNHNYYNGVCADCNHTHENHTAGDYDYNDENTHTLICGKCGLDFETANHNYGNWIEHNTENHKKICADCNHVVYEAHTFENGICTGCSFECTEHNFEDGECTICHKTCSHNFSGYQAINSFQHARTCSTCNFEDIGDHTYTNGTCTVCNSSCGHFNGFNEETGACLNGCGIVHTSHTFENGVCSVCGYECQHNYRDGVCSVCGYECQHNWVLGYCENCQMPHNCEFGDDIVERDAEGHYTWCNECYKYSEVIPHEWDLGHCLECGYNCVHNWEDGVCSTCMLSCSHENDDWLNGGTCSNCGDHNCLMYGAYVCVYKDKNLHEEKCTLCGDVITTLSHTFDNGVCVECNYECEHEYDNDNYCTNCRKHDCEADNDFMYHNAGENHDKECLSCGITQYSLPHNIVNGDCTLCDYCHEHAYVNSVCTICGETCSHYADSDYWNKYEESHSQTCVYCGAEFNQGSHNMVDNWCTTCNYHDCEAGQNCFYYSEPMEDAGIVCMRNCETCYTITQVPHDYSNGVCKNCNYECEHDIEDCECTICDYENHSWNYGTCSQCGGSHVCSKESDYSYYDYGSDDDCRVTCGICYNEWSAGHDYVNGECLNCEHVHSEHLYDENHYCKCGIHNCAEVDNFEIVEYNDVLHAKKCVDCGKVVETNKHTLDANNVCTVCGNEHTTHSYNLYEGSDGIRHFYECLVCEHRYYENHNFDGIGYGAICTVCNIVHDQCVIEEYDRYDYVEHYGDCVCGNSMAGAHSFNNGECTQCDFVCNHIEWSNGKCVNCRKEHENHTFGDFENKDSSRHARKCSVCNYEDLASHTFEDGVCTVCNCECVHEYSWKRCTKCGKEHDCAGEGTLTRSVNGNEYCSMYCGICYYEDFDGHNYVNGVCTLCEHVCTHYFYDGKCNYCKTPHNCSTDTIVNFSEQYHYCKCECEAYIEIPHDWRDGVCIECNYVCEHEYEEDDYLYYCTICSKHNCEECDDFQYVDLENGYHSRFCYECEKTVEIKHEWTENRRCEKCDAKCLHTEYDEYYNCLECGNHNCYADDADYYVKVNDEQCRMYCDSCDFEEVFAHNFENCECTYCGYSIHSFKPVTPEDEEDHKKECANCGLILLEGHNWSSSVCTECGYECIDHVFDSSYVGECYCMYCDYENHSWDEGHCVNCAAEHECCENDFEYRGTANYCIATCSVCARYTNGAHEYENGVCTVCGYEHDCANNGTVSDGYCICGKAHNCAETNKFNYTSEWDYECIKTCRLCGTSNTIDHAYDSNSVCANCGNVCGHYYASWHNDGLCAYCYAPHEDHTFEDDYCTVCYKHDCTTVNEFSYTTKDDVICIEKCSVCELSREIEHKYRSASGDCDYCGHYHQNHKNAKPTMSDDSRHSLSCEICGIDLGFEDHNYNVEQENDYEHRKICEDCDHVYFEPHKFVDSKCTLCGYECVNHEISNCVCTICGLENHSWNLGTCDDCGEEHDEHDFVDCVCFICGRANHNIIDCECTICDYENHDWNYGYCTYCQKECDHSSVENERCTICGYSCYGQIEEHRYDENLFCKICGYHDCEGLGNFTEVAGGTDEACKIINCHVCEKAKNVPHEYVGGSCNTCGYTHENHNWYYTADSYYHYKTCEVCNYDIPDIHDWENSVCTVCEYKCDVPHTDCTCIDCDYENHIYNIGECERCGYKHVNHNFSEYEQDGTSEHSRECSVCGYVEFENHKWDNSKCTVCEYECVNHEISNCECSICGDLIHNFNENCECEDCGQRHNYIYSSYTEYEDRYVCDNCGDSYTVDHNYDAGKCIVCGYEHVDHYDITDCVCGICGGEAHIVDEHCFCIDCDKMCHDFVNDICANCGYDHTSHKNAGEYAYVDENTHSTVCEACGEVYGERWYHDYMFDYEEDGAHYYTCIECYHILVREGHKINNYESGFDEHFGTCDCGEVIFEPHTFENGECTECGYNEE